MVAAQGGDAEVLTTLATTVHRAPFVAELRADRSGTVQQVDAEAVGVAVLELGAGRSKASDAVDFAVGCDQIVKTGTQVRAGDLLLRIHSRDADRVDQAKATLKRGIRIE